MKFILFTPIVKSSAIARMASLIAQKLIAKGHELYVVRTEGEDYCNHPTYDFGKNIFSWRNLNQIHEIAESADALIYQVGDNYELHQGCIPWLTQLSGIVCLHDICLINLFCGWSQYNLQEAQSILNVWYGFKMASQFFQYQTLDSFIEGTHAHAPMTEWICSLACAVITHSSWHIGRVLNSCSGLVYTLPLPYEPSIKFAENETFKLKKKHRGFHILTIGNVNTNKRADSVIQAIAKDPFLKKNIVYQLVGSVTDEMKMKLSKLANLYQVRLIISGQLSDAELGEAIHQADLISCLRWPALESASASTIEAMLNAKPTIVTNTGFYQEIPDNCTLKINPENEMNDIVDALKRCMNNPSYLKELGLQGYQWAKEHFTADNYVSKLIEIVPSAVRTKVINDGFQFFTKQIYNWGANKEVLLDNDFFMKSLSIFELPYKNAI